MGLFDSIRHTFNGNAPRLAPSPENKLTQQLSQVQQMRSDFHTEAAHDQAAQESMTQWPASELWQGFRGKRNVANADPTMLEVEGGVVTFEHARTIIPQDGGHVSREDDAVKVSSPSGSPYQAMSASA